MFMYDKHPHMPDAECGTLDTKNNSFVFTYGLTFADEKHNEHILGKFE